MTPYEEFQLERYGNILSETGTEELESGKEESEKFREWFHVEHEKQLSEPEKY